MQYTDLIDIIEKKVSNKSGIKYDSCIILPPPNITGNLHIGHALNIFIQDFKVRHYELLGHKIRWIPGTDHSGIYAQIILSKKLEEIKICCNNDSELMNHMWQWKEVCETNILQQIQRMHPCIDYDSYKFTMDKEIQKGVTEVFCRLYEKGLLFRDKRIVNWDIDLQTVLSDIEVENKELEGLLWFIKYELEDGGYVEVATTRPETIFADEAIAVHPDDARYKCIQGKRAYVPLTDKLIPIVTHKGCEISKGSGAVKIDPAHGVLDFEIGREYDLPCRCIIDKSGSMCGDIPKWLVGMDRFLARDEIVKRLQEAGHLLKSEQIMHFVPVGQKSGSILEPMIMDQWFLDMPQLKEKLVNQEVKIYPESCRNIYIQDIEKLKPWCISRQLWWGHRIPAWYDKEGKIIVARTEEEAHRLTGGRPIEQDPDVLDTWFSSSLWPFVATGWPKQEFYPNKFLVTGRDILFFWVMKMMLMAAALDLRNPFESVYLHGLIKIDGAKMSKSKGNVIDPMHIIKQQGCDIFRFALLSLNSVGLDVQFSQNQVDAARKFMIKIYNAINFAKQRCIDAPSIANLKSLQHQANTWIVKQILDFKSDFDSCIKQPNWFQASQGIYDLFWNKFCSIYLEIFKYLDKGEYAEESRSVLKFISNKLLQLLYPITPMIAEYMWFGEGDIPEGYSDKIDYDLDAEDFGKFLHFAASVRSIFSKFKVNKNIEVQTNMPTEIPLLEHLTGYKFTFVKDIFLPTCSINGFSIYIPSYKASSESVQKEIDSLKHNINHCTQLLSNDGFIKNASQEKIKEIQDILKTAEKDIEVYQSFKSSF